MRMSALFNRTRRETPSDVEAVSQQLLMRAGYISPSAAGAFSYLPLGRRCLNKIEKMARSEMDAIGGQEITLPAMQSSENGQEEAVAELLRAIVHSYRQLPALLYQTETRRQEGAHARAGLMRAKEDLMLDSYSLDADQPGLDLQYQAHQRAFSKLFNDIGLPIATVQGNAGRLAGLKAHESIYLSPIGEDSLLCCDQCGYSANRQIARINKQRPQQEILLPLKKIATPHTTSIEALADLLRIPSSRTAKAVFLMASPAKAASEEAEKEFFVFAVVRGDMEVSETKLANLIQARALRPATEAEIRATGAVPGYASPLGLKDVLVIVDDLLVDCPNLVAGANEEGYHMLNVNLGRDYQASLAADITAARAGDGCPNCGASMRSSSGIEVGHLIQSDVNYSTALGSTFLDETGQIRPVRMGSYSLWIGRLLACLAEQYHDESGLCWPISVAPYAVQLVLLGSKTGSTESTAQTLYDSLPAAGVEVLFDDRQESAGVKFNDADLIGLPLRLTVGERNLKQGMVELKHRTAKQGLLFTVEETIEKVTAEIANLQQEKIKG